MTGGGHAPLEEAMSVLGVPVMTKKSCMATEKDVAQQWWTSLEESMQEAAEEDKKLVIERGSFHEGVPAITLNILGHVLRMPKYITSCTRPPVWRHLRVNRSSERGLCLLIA